MDTVITIGRAKQHYRLNSTGWQMRGLSRWESRLGIMAAETMKWLRADKHYGPALFVQVEKTAGPLRPDGGSSRGVDMYGAPSFTSAARW